MSGELGKASLDLEANVGPFERHVAEAEHRSDSLKDKLAAVAGVANVAESALNDVKMGAAQGVESRISAQEILSGVHGVSDEARVAAIELDRVKLSTEQAAETAAAADLIDHKLDDIHDNANRARRALDRVKLAGGVPGRSGVGVGPFGSGFGRVGAVGAAIGLGVLTTPAAGPAAIGLLASIPTLAAAGAGALGVLALAFQGVFKAIGGDKKAFDELTASQQQFVLTIRSLAGWFDRLKQIAAQSVFPGLTKGLKAALSPGTLNAITTAVVQVGRALGAAGAAWGKYFGSARFQHILGPLMQSAARNIGKLSDTFLHLFDALGVIARAAIPFTNWLVGAIDKGAKFADTWLRARDASGQLAGALNGAKDSLRLVAHLAGSLIGAVIALGGAIYPVAKVAVKLLTDGLNALGGGIKKATPDIRGALGGALHLVAQIAKTVGPVLGTLADIALKLVGVLARALVPIVKALAPLFSALRDVFREIAPPLQRLIKDVAHALVPAVKALVKPAAQMLHALGPVLAGALKVLRPILVLVAHAIEGLAIGFGYMTSAAAKAIASITRHWHGIGSFFRKLGHEIVQAFKYAWYALKVGALKAALAVVEPFSHLPAFLGGWARDAKNAMQHQLDKLHAPNMDWGSYAAAAGAATGAAWGKAFQASLPPALRGLMGPSAPPAKDGTSGTKHGHGNSNEPKPGTHAWYMKNLGYDPTQQPTYSTPPPFDTTGSGSSGASKAKPLTAAQRMQLHLQYVLDQAKVAVQNATQGTKAWDRAVHAEEKALKAEIRYWDKRAHNRDLSIKARDEALRKELAYQKQLKALLAPIKQAAAANIAQFLSTFKAIEGTFGGNSIAMMDSQNVGGGKKTDTHLYDLKNEARESNRHLRAMRDKARFPGSRTNFDAAMAATS